MKKTAFAGTLAAFIFLPSLVLAQTWDGKPPLIQVTGTGTIRAEPDIATIRIGVATEDPRPQDAVARNTEATQKVIKELEAADIGKKDLKTSSFSVFPQYKTDGGNKQTLPTGCQIP